MSTTPAPQPPRRRFRLELHDLPSAPDVPPVEIRLRAALKRLLRRFRLVCTRVEEIQEEPQKESTP
jgi:hypothetical protein